MIFEKKYGIDLGSDTVKIYSQFRNKVYKARNLVAASDHTIIAVGNEAFEMWEKTPAEIQVFSPMEMGNIANLELQEILIYRMMLGLDRFWRTGSKVYFSVPPDMSAIERRAFHQVVNGHWIRRGKTFLVEAAFCDALGMDLDPDREEGMMLVNMGDQTTRFSIISAGRILMSRVIPIGGAKIDAAIAQEIRRRYQIQSGYRTASRLKLEMGRLSDQKKETRRIVGIDMVSGLPREEEVSSYVVNAGIMNCINELADQIRIFMERIPPSMSYRISSEGIFLCGGCARIPYLETYLGSSTGYTFNLSERYEDTTVVGLEKVIHEKAYRKWVM